MIISVSKRHIKRRSLIAIAVIVALNFMSSCGLDDANSIYSTKYPVRFFFEINRSAELFNTMGNPGMYVTIRQVEGLIRITDVTGKHHDYDPTKLGTDFLYGLGGLIVGNTVMNEPVAYDLSCPNCDRSSYRLTLPGNGSAKCNHCGITYDLNNNGWILSTTDSTADNLRALYRYKINYNGVAINVFN